MKKTQTCAYTFTKDEHFMLHQKDKLMVISACSGHGYKFAAAIGQRIAKHGFHDQQTLKNWLEARE